MAEVFGVHGRVGKWLELAHDRRALRADGYAFTGAAGVAGLANEAANSHAELKIRREGHADGV